MALTVYTARISYDGPDRLDVTRGTADRASAIGRVSQGAPFAPSRELLRRYLRARAAGQAAINALWPTYQSEYRAEMRASFRQHRAAWDALLARDEVTLVCFCRDHEHCHRGVLADILRRLGAHPHGER